MPSNKRVFTLRLSDEVFDGTDTSGNRAKQRRTDAPSNRRCFSV